METSHLTPDLQALDALEILDEASVSLARDLARRVSAEVGLSQTAAESLATVTSELVRNQMAHARKGRVYARAVQRGGVAGVEVIAADEGRGIPEPARAFKGDVQDPAGMGSGLSSATRLADELDFDVRQEEGTCIRARKFAGPVPYRSEIAILGRGSEVRGVSGDDGTFLRLGDDVVFAVADGLGHGALAREASQRAIELVQQHPSVRPDQLIRDCDAALRGTRGAVMAVAKIARRASTLEHACLGNITSQVVRLRQTHRFSAPSGVVGFDDPRTKKLGTETASLFPGDVVLMYTDGFKSGIDISHQFELLREHPLVIADYLLTHFGRPDDDALILVAR